MGPVPSSPRSVRSRCDTARCRERVSTAGDILDPSLLRSVIVHRSDPEGGEPRQHGGPGHAQPRPEPGDITATITSPAFRSPTTVARFGSRLVLVNARFDLSLPPPFGPGAPPGTDYDVVLVRA